MKKTTIHIGTGCKGSCQMCFEHREPEKYDFDEYFSRIKDFIIKYKPRIISIFENRKSDPLSEPNLPTLVNWLAERRHIKKINIITSGIYGIPEVLKKIEKVHWGISIDGPKDFHDENREEGSFDKAIAIVKGLIAAGQTVFVRTIATKTLLQCNLNKVKGFYKELKQMGARVYVQRYTSKLHRDISEFINIDNIKKLLPKWIFTSWKFLKEKTTCLDPSGIFMCPNEPLLAGPNIDIGKILTGPCFYCGVGYTYDTPQKKKYKVRIKKSVFADVEVELMVLQDKQGHKDAEEEALKRSENITDWEDEEIRAIDSKEID